MLASSEHENGAYRKLHAAIGTYSVSKLLANPGFANVREGAEPRYIGSEQ